jgi:hypothetical protein
LFKGGLIFPAAVAGRDGNSAQGELRSLYLAGDASNVPLVSPLAQKLPALGGIEGALSPRFGDLPARTYWGFFEPLMRNALQNTPRIRAQR